MEALGKSLYNALRINWLEESSPQIETWKIEDYRALETKEIYKRLETLHICLSEESFLSYAETCSSPEELTETLWVGSLDPEEMDQAYLLLFELWRRLIPEKQTLSLFCDELDHLIYLFDHDLLKDKQPLEDAIEHVEAILDENVDQGTAPQETFENFCKYLAHDFERFIYDYISLQLDENEDIYASELLDAFYEYAADKSWFDLLRVRIYYKTDAEEGHLMLDRLLEQTQEAPDLDLLLEILRFLIHQADINEFNKVAMLCKKLLKNEEDFQELLALTCAFYRLLDREKKEDTIAQILHKRAPIDLNHPLNPQDRDLATFYRELFL